MDFSAYLFGRNAQPVADHRLIFVQPADELKIDAVADAPVYKPGGEARIRFHVTNSRGEGVSAALGLQVVDEAVFALAEKQPGFAKVFFYLEQEVMKPRYEIHSIGMSEIVEPAEKSKIEQRNRAARALFSATELVGANKFETEFGRTVPMEKYQEYAGRYQAHFLDQIHELAERLSLAYRDNPENGDLARVFARISKSGGGECLDSWGTPFRLEPAQWYRDKARYIVRSAGADHRFDTPDDMAAYVEVHRGTVLGHPDSDTLTLNIEHDRGPFNGLAEIVGTITDPSGAVISGASVAIREVSTGKKRAVATDAAGQFTLAGVPAGRYDLQVSQAGFKTASRRITLRARDRVVVSTILSIGSVSEAVEVSAASVIVESRNRVMKATGGNVAALAINGRNFTDLAVPAAPVAGPIDIGASTNIAIRAKDKQEAPVRLRTSVPTSPRLSTSIPKSSPTKTDRRPSRFPWQTPSPPGAWRCSHPRLTAHWAAARPA